MPRGDGTGPDGMGARTGRAAGYCAGYDVPGYMNPYPLGSRRSAGGFGRGRGNRRSYYFTGLPFWQRHAPKTSLSSLEPEEEMERLRQNADQLKAELDEIQARMEELNSTKKEE